MTKDETKNLPVYVLPFSHLDLFWLGTREECLSRGNYVISKALDILEEHENFRYLLETMNFIDNYLSCYPDEIDRIRKLVKTGRLELGPLWSGIYQNLPGGETLARNSLYAKRYAAEKIGCNPEVAHLGDLPGYTPQYPQIAAECGIRYVVITRCGDVNNPLFIWEGLENSQILAYFAMRTYCFLCKYLAFDWVKERPGIDEELEKMFNEDQENKPYPSLYHWGSDLVAFHEEVVKNVRLWNEDEKRTRKMLFATPSEYFASVESHKNLPIFHGEQPSAWPNIESSWPDVWPEDIPCESALHMAEFLSTFCLSRGWNDYPSEWLEEAWKSLLDGMDHNQNGQGGETADRDKLQLKLWSRYTAEKIIDKMSWRLASKVSRLHDKAFPVVVFNPMSWRRSGMVCSRCAAMGEIYPGQANTDFAEGTMLVDEKGNTIPFVQLKRTEGLSFSMDIAFNASDVPAAGYKTYYLVPGKNPYNETKTCKITEERNSSDHGFNKNHQENITYENSFYRMRVDTVTGEINLFDLKRQTAIFEKMAIIGVEERCGNYISDMTASGRTFPTVIKKVETIDNNAVWCKCRITGSIYDMPFTQTLTLYHDTAEIAVENEIDWIESRCIRIEQTFPYAGQGEDICYGVPYGYVRYPETMTPPSKFGDEIPVEDRQKLRLSRHWVDIGDDSVGVTVGCDHRMWEFNGKELRSYMVRGIGYCWGITRKPTGETENIPRPPKGKYTFQYRIRSRQDSLSSASSYRCGWELNHPMKGVAVCDVVGKDTASAADSLLDFTDSSMVVTAIKKTEIGDGIVIRGFESAGQTTEINIPEFSDRTVLQTNILEQTREPVNSKCQSFEIKTMFFEREK